MIQQTHEEKIAMYMKLSKKELIEMLLENQRLVDQLSQPVTLPWVQPYAPTTAPYVPVYPTVSPTVWPPNTPIWLVDSASQPTYTCDGATSYTAAKYTT